ncbi:nucleic acid/nucleotide deaminase domain-containing protein [Pseudomonas inefficax]|uniref:nucleic acid/nucleotide deaminase domain-containing protein n=1 Tax=Pseudomonas inefficax TaxID=2078786 RepID=UPI004046A35B
MEGNFNAAKTNYAAVKYTLNGKEHVEVMRNTPGGLHSEEKLLAKYANRSEITINELCSERRPCPGCNSLVNRYSPKNTFTFQYSASGRSALQSTLSNIKKPFAEKTP